MKRILSFITGFILFSSMGSSGWAQETERYPIMKPDRETREKWYQETFGPNAQQAHIDPLIAETLDWGPKPVLLDKITYTPSERNQGSCGNCWVWAGTAQLEILHNVEHGVNDRLSIQFFDSCFPTTTDGYYPCDGGNLGTFLNFYNTWSVAPYVPWSNSNAYYQDASGGTAPHVACSAIAQAPAYNGDPNAFTRATVPTTGGVGQAAAIANIKNVLGQNKGVEFDFCLADHNDWYGAGGFQDFFDHSSETVIWNPDQYCGHWWVNGEGGCHGVVIVGYDDNAADPTNPYWIVLNSWGAPTGHPNGFFRMKMNMNYNCILHEAGYSDWYARGFQTINTANDPFYDANSLYMAAKGANTSNLFIRKKNSGGTWGGWTQINGTTTHAPAMASFNSKLYMAVKGVATNKIWLRSMDPWGTWSPWSDTMGGSTSEAPALVVFRNRLYLFARGNNSDVIWYNSMGTNGTWAGWQQVPDSHTIVSSPAVAVLNNQLVCYQVGWDGAIYFNRMRSDGGWMGWGGLPYNMITDVGISATIFNNRILLVAKGQDGVPNASKISYIYSDDGDPGLYYPWALTPGGTTTQKPQVAWGPTPDEFYITVKGFSTGIMWENHYDQIEGWAGWTQSAGSSTHAPSVNTYYLGHW